MTTDPPATGARPDVLVVIVNYGTAQLTLRSLEALRAERPRSKYDVVAYVVENASGDEQALRAGISSRYADFAHLIASPRNGGFGAGNNLALATARARGVAPRFVHFLNPDTEIRPGAVDALVDFLGAHPNAGIVGGSFEEEDGTPWLRGFRFPSLWSEVVDACRLGAVSRVLDKHVVSLHLGSTPERVDWVSGASVMFRREVLDQAGGFDEGFFLYFEEVDLCRRASEAGWECWYVPESRVMHAFGQATGVTVLGQAPRRLPAYWFESRRRYYVKSHGMAYSAVTDAARLLATPIGITRDLLKREPRVPRFSRDLFAHSVLRRRNRVANRPAD